MIKKKFVKIVKNFITNDEVEVLNQWTFDNYRKPYFKDPKMNLYEIQTRYTTRHAHYRREDYKDYKVKYPKEVYSIQKRLFDYLKIEHTNTIPFPHFTDGISTTLCHSLGDSPGGGCVYHKDSVYVDNTHTLHCNFVTQNPKCGGITYIEEKPYYFGERDLIMYITSDLEHGASDVSGDVPRILWCFGFYLTHQEMNEIFDEYEFNYH